MTNINDFIEKANGFLPGNIHNFKLGLICILLNRSLLIEDVPGMGKTTFVKFLGKSLGFKFNRIQFTSDLLPSDILGVSIYDKTSGEFIFKKGPIFAELILADELNRGTPKVQSALLEALEERQVSIDGTTYPLPERFCLIATQNPRGQFGTYPLPESQLDRFLFKTSMGKLSRNEELKLLSENNRSDEISHLGQMISDQELGYWKKSIREVKTSENILSYILDIVEATRMSSEISGLSPRATRDLVDAVKGYAFICGRDFVIPDDVQTIFPYVAGHRLYTSQTYSIEQEQVKARSILNSIKVKPE